MKKRKQLLGASFTATMWVSGIACGGGGAVPPKPRGANLTILANAPSASAAGTTIDSIAIKLTDAAGDPVGGTAITFAAGFGSGKLSPAVGTTNASGRAAAAWTVGTVAGVQDQATASASGGLSVAFSTRVIPGPPAALTLTTPRTTTVDSGARATPAFTATDAFGNTTPSTSLSYASRGSAATVDASGVVTGSAHGQALIVARTTDNASLADSTLVLVGFAHGPLLYTDLPAFTLAHDTTVVVTLILDMRSSGERLGSATVHVAWNPSLLTYVSDVDATGVGAIVNALNAASGTLDLAVASANGFSGVTQLRRITFRAASTAGQAGTLALTLSQLAGAGTYDDLTSVAVAASYPVATR